MATGFGIPADAAGNGTTPEDIQTLTATKYQNAGIIDGAAVTTRSDWKYQVTRGAVLVDTGAGMAVEVPVEPVTLDAPAAPATGTATHTIYVVQDQPASTGSSLRRVVVTTGTAPAGAVVLDKRSVPAGATATTSTTSVYDRNYAVPTGGSIGSLGYHQDTNTTPWPETKITRGNLRINVPTDRNIDIQMTSTISLSDANGFTPDRNELMSVLYQIFIDGTLRKSWEVSVGRLWESKQFTTTERVSAGPHTIHYTAERKWRHPDIPTGQGYWVVRVGGPDQYRGNTISVIDRGVAK